MGERVWIGMDNGSARTAPLRSISSFLVLRRFGCRQRRLRGGRLLGIPALTAIQAVRLAQIGSEATVLIAGGAGSVAHYAIQLAKLREARVITTVSNDVKATHARAAGVDETINYRTEDVGERVKALTDGRGVDALIEMDLSANAKLLSGGPTASLHGRRVRHVGE